MPKKKPVEVAPIPAPTPPVVAVPTLTFTELMAHVLAADLHFAFKVTPDARPENHYEAWCNGEKADGSNPVVTALSAIAMGVISEQERTKRHTADLATRKARLEKITALLPDVTAHVPSKDGSACDRCGETHGSAESMIDAMMQSMGKALGVQIQKVEPPGAVVKKDRAKKPTN